MVNIHHREFPESASHCWSCELIKGFFFDLGHKKAISNKSNHLPWRRHHERANRRGHACIYIILLWSHPSRRVAFRQKNQQTVTNQTRSRLAVRLHIQNDIMHLSLLCLPNLRIRSRANAIAHLWKGETREPGG